MLTRRKHIHIGLCAQDNALARAHSAVVARRNICTQTSCGCAYVCVCGGGGLRRHSHSYHGGLCPRGLPSLLLGRRGSCDTVQPCRRPGRGGALDGVDPGRGARGRVGPTCQSLQMKSRISRQINAMERLGGAVFKDAYACYTGKCKCKCK
jgi:hypothetical protein